MSRFSQAISEGDGISIIPAVSGDVAALAAAAEAAGAEAVAVASASDAAIVRAGVTVPVLAREPVADRERLAALHTAGADAFVLAYGELEGHADLLELLHGEALALDTDCVLDVRDEEELERALERVDPDILLMPRGAAGAEEEELERALDLLPDVPAGKLVVVESGLVTREQVRALERAGVDAVVVCDLAGVVDFSRAVEELAGGVPPEP